jgi:hypothetical protein
MEYHDLEKMTVIQLREEAKKFADLKGVTAMKKDELIHILVERHGIAVPDKKHHTAPRGPMGKTALKNKIAALHVEQDAARSAHDNKQADLLRRRIHTLKHRLRKIS